MTLRQYLAVMSLGTALCYSAWYLVLLQTNPVTGGLFALLFFYATFFLALVGTFAVVGFAVRVWLLKQEDVIFRHVRKTFRQGVLFALFVCISLVLKRTGLFNVWMISLALVLVVLLEFLFISYIHTPKVRRIPAQHHKEHL